MKMKRMVPVLLAVATSAAVVSPACAQVTERRGFIGLGIGPATSVGAFKETGGPYDPGGSALSGFTSTLLSVGYRFGKRWGVAGNLAYTQLDMRVTGGNDWWELSELTVGPMYAIPLGTKTALDLKGLIGLMGSAEVTGGYGSLDRSGGALMYDLRSTLRHDVFRRWAVFGEAGFIYSNQQLGDGTRKDVRALISGMGIAFRPAW